MKNTLRLDACCLLLPVSAMLFIQPPTLHAQASVNFQHQIRPLLSEACFHCHGPDEKTRMMGLRLDTKAGLFEKRQSGRIVTVPGDPAASLLYQRISHANPALRMPPAASGKALTEEQQALIKRWIEQGAGYQEHWSFAAPVRPALPKVNNERWPRNPIDQFILTRLEATGLNPATEAERRTLIRRVSLDLTGLPPNPTEIEAFVKDPDPNAYEKLVDRLLESQHYGEHRARYWLDAARYADTHGLHIDNYREMWPYRDWVIAAFNRNMPFNRFTVEQLAGDLLPNATLEQRIATGFHRCNVTTNEGGAIPEEIDAMYAKDRVETTSMVWLGLTTGCASCHDHKFDPISTRDFYSLAAFFRNTLQRPMDGNIPDTPPVLPVPASADLAKWERLREEIAEQRRLERDRKHESLGRVDQHLDELRRRFAGGALVDPAQQLIAYSQPNNAELPAGVSITAGPAPSLQAVRFSPKSDLPLSSQTSLDAEKAFTIALWMFLPVAEDNFTIVSEFQRGGKNSDDDEAAAGRGWKIEVNARIPALRLFADTNIQVRGSNAQRLTPGTWNHLVFTYDGSGYQGGMSFFLNGAAAVAEGGETSRQLRGQLSVAAPLRLGSDTTRYFPGGAIADFRVYGRMLTADEVRLMANEDAIQSALTKSASLLSPVNREHLNLLYLTRIDTTFRDLTTKRARLDSEQRAIRYRSPVTHVLQEREGAMPEAHVLFRGQYDQPREKVTPAVPGVLPPMAEPLPRNRLGLAQWLVDPANPLMARVTVNRFWQEVMGAGLVRTAGDFGSQGEQPSHPELLDWLAVEFRESGWDVKGLMRLLVTSATYRQKSLLTEEKKRADPENRLLSRGPRFRMDAEMLRDLALASSGLLVRRIGGPSVKPYQPEGIWETVAMKGSNTRFYKQDRGERLYRRSLYTFWKRAAPPASMEIFNAPTRENCTVQRERTNTPLQALATMNDPQFVEASRHLAEVALREAAGFDARLDRITLPVLARALTERERNTVRKSWEEFMAYFDRQPERARQLLSVGESQPDNGLQAAEVAAWTMTASSILNLDESFNK